MSGLTILHVDDDSDDVALLQHACRKAGMAVNLLGASDGDEAIAYLNGRDQFADREQFPLPSLILLDLKMPRVSGFEVLNWVRKNHNLKGLPVIVLSSSNRADDVNRAYGLGANSYLIKPVGYEALVEMVKAIQLYWLTFNERPAG